MADRKNEPDPTPVVDRTPLGSVFLHGLIFGLGYLTVVGGAKLLGRALSSNPKALDEGE